MLSVALANTYTALGHNVIVYGLDSPKGYNYSSYCKCNLLSDKLNYEILIQSDIIIYASGAGVQAALSTPSSLMYSLNVNVPVEITLQLKRYEYKGIFISFGSYMEIGVNDEDGKSFTEEGMVCSHLPVTNDYGLSKRLYSRYMNDFNADFTFWHFILPNMFSYNDFKSGTRLIPYCLQYIKDYKSNLHPTIPKFSSGTQTREFILMEDIFPLILQAVSRKMPSGIYNMGGGKFQSIRQLVESIFDFYSVPCKNDYFGQSVRRDGDIQSLRLDSNKLRKNLGTLPSTSLEDVLRSLSIC